MTATAMAVFVLFAGQNLDQWIQLAGRWDVANGAMFCQEAPAEIRSSYESDCFKLRFEYRQTAHGGNMLHLHSSATGGGIGIVLTSSGLARPGCRPPEGVTISDNEWIKAEIDVTGTQLTAVATKLTNQMPLSRWTLPIPPDERGFIRFSVLNTGLQIRHVVVQEDLFAPLFESDKLTGWESAHRARNEGEPAWSIHGQTVQCNNASNDWLHTLHTFDNFILRLEYWLPPRGNSGIVVRAPLEEQPGKVGLQFAIQDEGLNRGENAPVQISGSIPGNIVPETRVACPVEQWNAIEIRCEGRHVRTTLNGIQLYNVQLDNPRKDLDNRLHPLTTRRAAGFIGLLGSDTTVKFRHVRIQPLKQSVSVAPSERH